MAPRIDGPSNYQPPTESTKTESVESKTTAPTSEPSQPADAQQEAKTSEKNSEGSKQHATEQKAHFDVRGQYLREQLESKLQIADGAGNEAIQNAIRDTGALFAAPETPKILYPKEIRDIQQSINQQRANNDKPQIAVTGSQDADTKQAIKEFQIQSGIKPANGQIDVATRERLLLENDNQFQKLPDASKKGIRDYMNSLGQDKEALRNIRNLATKPGFEGLVGVFDSAGFRSLDKTTKMQVVKAFNDFGDSFLTAHHLKDLIETPGFDRIPRESRKDAINTLLRNPDNTKFLENFRFLLDSNGFHNIPHPTQNSILRILAQHGGDEQVAVNLRMLTQTNVFQNPGLADMQQRMLDAFAQNPHGASTVDNLTNLAGTTGFGNLDPDIQAQTLNQVASSNVRYDAGRIGNLMILAQASHFQKLQPDIRALMLETLAARPENTALAEALRDLANDPRFRHDPRSQRQAILNLGDRIP